MVAVAMSASASAYASSSAVVGRALVMRGGVVVAWGLVYHAWGLLAGCHAELLDICQLAACPYENDHLICFRFIGHIMGKAMFNNQPVKGRMIKHFYKHILG
jgi:hypothetical protein